MEGWKLAQSNRRLRAVRLGITVGLATLFLVVLLCGLRGVTPAHAGPGTLYVDRASGQDISTCGTTSTPCKTISYTLNSRASGGDTIRVAQGVYTENLTINISVTVEGGYEAAGWTRNITQYETIIDGSNSRTVEGDWDGSVMKAAVISDGAEYKMWFDGANLLDEAQVGLSSSGDGISWTKHLTNPVLTNTISAWDESSREHAPFVLKEGGVYKMWYEGRDGNVRQLGYVTSTNGIDWNKYAGNPILPAGPDGYDQEAAAHGSVLNDGGTYKLWYHAVGDEGAIIAYATSPNGLNWTKQGPVLKPASAGNWDDYALWGPSVLKLNGMYWMWYAAAGSQAPAIGVVTSTNGITWTRFLAAPVVTETAPIGDPHVISDGGKLKMWYSIYEQGVIAYAESNDGISWTKSPSNPVLTPGTPGQWGQPVVAFVEGSDDSMLDGFTVRNGEAEYGGGIFIDGAQVTVQDCVVTGNNAYRAGGGIDVAWGADATIHNTQVLSNSVSQRFGGGLALYNSRATIDSCLIRGNLAHDAGGGIEINGSTVTVTASTIVSNTATFAGGGVRVVGDSGLGSLRMMNSFVIHNTAPIENGGGIEFGYNYMGELVNVTIADNQAASGGGIAESFSGLVVTVTNSIIIFNEGGDVLGSNYYITFSDIGNGWPGQGNISDDPRFVDSAGCDYHLQPWSLCIDTGTNVSAPTTDFEGDSRPLDGDLNGVAITDMGADEFRPYQIYLPITLKNFEP